MAVIVERGAAGRRWLSCLLLVLVAGSSLAREPSVALDELLEAEYVGVAVLPGGDGAAVALRIANGGEPTVVPIFIGVTEAAAIARAERGLRPSRPLTHELLADVMSAAQLRLVRVVIDELRDGIFHATLEFRQGGDRSASIWVDARPSDSLALALSQQAPILLAPAIVEAAPEWEHELPDRGQRMETRWEL